MTNSTEETIEENAKKPKRAKGDLGEVEQHALKDQIEADRYLASKKSGNKPTRALRFTKLSPPGAA
jgi:hypothetical protein